MRPLARCSPSVTPRRRRLAFGWPLLADARPPVCAHSQDAPWLFAGLLPLLVAVVVATIADTGLDAKAVAMLGVLAAAGAALRPLGAGTAVSSRCSS